MNWLKRFMTGRYGTDHLTIVILILSLLLSFIAQLSNLSWLALVVYILLGIGLYRMLSKNVSKRRMENYRFFMLISPISSWYLKTRNVIKDKKIHRYYMCPNCRTKLRVPKGKGKIMITCTKCKTKFAKKT